MKRFFLLSCFSIMLSACAYTPQKATLEVTPEILESNLGRGRTIAVNIMDERPDKGLGHRGGVYGRGAEITTDQDITEIILDALYEGLTTKGFKPVSGGQKSDKKLDAEFRHFEYYTSTGAFTGGVHVKAAMKVRAKGKVEYENMYRVEKENRVVFVPGAESNEKLLNETLTEMVERVFQDEDLLHTLSQ